MQGICPLLYHLHHHRRLCPDPQGFSFGVRPSRIRGIILKTLLSGLSLSTIVSFTPDSPDSYDMSAPAPILLYCAVTGSFSSSSYMTGVFSFFTVTEAPVSSSPSRVSSAGDVLMLHPSPLHDRAACLPTAASGCTVCCRLLCSCMNSRQGSFLLQSSHRSLSSPGCGRSR